MAVQRLLVGRPHLKGRDLWTLPRPSAPPQQKEAGYWLHMTKALAALVKQARRALDDSDPDAALRVCRTALKSPDGADNVKILVLIAQACQLTDPPRLDDAFRALSKAVELEPDSIHAWGMIRNVLRRLPPDPQRPISLRQAYEKLVVLCADNPKSQQRLRNELVEILEASDDHGFKLEALEVRLQNLPWSDQDLVAIANRQIELKVDCSVTLRELVTRRALPESMVDSLCRAVFSQSMDSDHEDFWSETFTLLNQLLDLHHSKTVLRFFVSLLLLYRRLFNRDKPFFKRVCFALLRLEPKDFVSWATVGCISIPLLSNMPENLDQVRAAVRLGEFSTSNIPFPKNEPFPLAVIIAESYDTTIGAQLELRPLDLVSMKVRWRSALDLIGDIVQKCPKLTAWEDAMKTSLRINACLFKSSSEAVNFLKTHHSMHPRAKRSLINSLMECGRFAEAVKFMVEFWPEDAPTWVLSALSWCRFQIAEAKQPETSLVDANVVIRRSPRCALYHARIGGMYLALEDNASVNKRRALDSFMMAARLDPLSSYPWTSLGRYYRDYKNDTARSLKCFRKSVALNATDFEAGISLCRLLSPASNEVVSVCKAAIDANPFFCEWPWQFLLQARLLRMEWLDCVGAIQNLLKATPKNVLLWTQLGLVYLRMGKYQSSARAYSKSVKLNDQNIRAHYSLADVYLRMDQTEDAISELEHTLSLDTGGLRPAIVELLRQTYYEHGRQLVQSGDIDDANKHFEKAINLPVLESSLLGPWKLFGDIQISRSDPVLAAKAYIRAAFRYPAEPESWYDFGIALFKEGRAQVASHCFKSAIALRTDYADAWIALAFALPLEKIKLRCLCLSHAVKSSEHQVAPSWTALALLALQYGDINAARKAVVEAQRSDPIFDQLPTVQGLVFRASLAISNESENAEPHN